MQLWHGSNAFIGKDPKKILETILNNDECNRTEIPVKFRNSLKSHDNALTLFIQVIQKLYEDEDRWRSNINTTAAVAMANAALNYHLLARHAIIHGYSSEAFPLFRASFERMTRCIVFQLNQDMAERFWAGKEIKQGEIRDFISKFFEKKTEGSYKLARECANNLYKHLSEVSHPNIKTLSFRTLNVQDKGRERNTGIDFSYGGELSDSFASMGIEIAIVYVVFSLFVLEMLGHEILSTWSAVLERKVADFFKKHMFF